MPYDLIDRAGVQKCLFLKRTLTRKQVCGKATLKPGVLSILTAITLCSTKGLRVPRRLPSSSLMKEAIGHVVTRRLTVDTYHIHNQHVEHTFDYYDRGFSIKEYNAH
jgi:hypothetical protein